MIENAAVVGASGALGNAFVWCLAELHPQAIIHACSRQDISFGMPNVQSHVMDYLDEVSIASVAGVAANEMPLDLVIVATGILHDGDMLPEKSLRDLSADKFQHLFFVNTITPALIAKHFIPKLHKDRRAVFAALSARVGSISDNRLGGWYAYRASKTALNMILKNAAIETARRNKQAVIVGLHPGTVDSALSKPFQGNVAEGKLFTPEYSAHKLSEMLEDLIPQNSGKCFAWDGKEIPS